MKAMDIPGYALFGQLTQQKTPEKGFPALISFQLQQKLIQTRGCIPVNLLITKGKRDPRDLTELPEALLDISIAVIFSLFHIFYFLSPRIYFCWY